MFGGDEIANNFQLWERTVSEKENPRPTTQMANILVSWARPLFA